MSKIDQNIRDISDMYDIWLAFRRARMNAGLLVSSPIPGMTNEEFERMREDAHTESPDAPIPRAVRRENE